MGERFVADGQTTQDAVAAERLQPFGVSGERGRGRACERDFFFALARWRARSGRDVI